MRERKVFRDGVVITHITIATKIVQIPMYRHKRLTTGMDYVATLYKNVLTPLQMARVYSACLPLFPDALSLTKAIAELATPSSANSVPLALANTLQGAEEDGALGPSQQPL